MLSTLIRLNSGHVRGLQTAWIRTFRHLPRGGVVVHPNRPDDELLTLYDETESNIDELGDLMNPSQHDRSHRHRQLKKGPNKSAKQLQAEFVKKKITEKKEKKFYNPKEPNLLTWAAKMQIKHLNQEDPIYWTPEMLANSFPASKDVVLKILKNNRVPINEAEIGNHDSGVYKNWLKLKEVSKMMEDSADLNDEEKLLMRYGKNVLHLLSHAAGNTLVPVPQSTFAFRTQEQIAEENKPVVKPVFSSILTSYEHDKGSLKTKSKVEETKPIGFNVNSVRILLEGISHSTDAENTNERVDSETDDDSIFKNHSQGHKADDVSVVPMFNDPSNRQKPKTINVSDHDVSMVRDSGHTNRHKAEDVSVVPMFSDPSNRQKPKTGNVSMVRDSGHTNRHKAEDISVVPMFNDPTNYQKPKTGNVSMVRDSGHTNRHKAEHASVVPMFSDPTNRQKPKTGNVSMVRDSGHTNRNKAEDASVVPMFSDPTIHSKPMTVKVSDHDVSMVRDSGHPLRIQTDVSMVRDSGHPIRNQTDVSMLRKSNHQYRHNNNISKLQKQSDDDIQVRPLFSDNSKYTTNTSRRKTSQPDDIKSRIINNFKSPADSSEQARQPDDIKSRIINNFKSPADSSEQARRPDEIKSGIRNNFNSPADSSEQARQPDDIKSRIINNFKSPADSSEQARQPDEIKSGIRNNFNSSADSSEHRTLDANHVEVMPLFNANQQGGSNKGWKGRSNFETGEKTECKSVVQPAGSQSDVHLNKYKRNTDYIFYVKKNHKEFCPKGLDSTFDEISLLLK